MIVSGIIQIQIMVYPTLGPFIVEDILHYGVLIYVHTILSVVGNYLVGILINRLLLTYILSKQVCDVWCVVILVRLAFLSVYSSL